MALRGAETAGRRHVVKVNAGSGGRGSSGETQVLRTAGGLTPTTERKISRRRSGGQNRVTSAWTMSGLRDWIWGSLGITAKGDCLVLGGGGGRGHLPT